MKANLLCLMMSLPLIFAGVAQGADVATKQKASTVAATKPLPAQITDKTTGMEFVLVKGGCYQMGDISGDGAPDEKPAHEVCVKDFYLGKYEVTQGQWQKVMGENPSMFKDCGMDCPVENVSWEMTQEFITKLNGLSKQKFRLPSEAEWEYAARNGGKAERWAGTSDEALLEEYAWFANNSEEKTHKVGLKKPNGLGLYDMNGNVREWCQDWYNENYYAKSPKANPIEDKDSDGQRVSRSGGWNRNAMNIRSSSRNKNDIKLQAPLDGLRLLLPAK